MHITRVSIVGQTVKAGLALRFRNRHWLFLDKRTELSPWLVLHRESVHDSELDELLLHGFPRSRTGDTLDCIVLTHFGLIEGDLYEPGWLVGRTERQRTAVFTGDLIVIKLPVSPNLQTDLLNPASLYWATESSLLEHPVGSVAHERGKMLIEMATLLMARWKAHDTENLEFKTRGRLHQLGAEGYAVGAGLVSGAVDFIEGIFNLIRLSLSITAQAFQITCEGIDQIIHGNFAQIRQSLMNAGQGIYNTAQELAAALKEGLRMLTLIGSDPVLRIGLMEFLDGYTESVAHLSRMNTAGQVIFIGIEVALALATAGGTLAVGAARLAARVGPFSRKLLTHMAQVAKALEKSRVEKLHVNPSAPAKATGSAAPSARKTNSTDQNKPNSGGKLTQTPGNTTSEGASSPKASCTKTCGEPISMINGQELLQLFDLAMPGLVGLNWQRTYSSANAQNQHNMGLGMGWSHPLGQHVQISDPLVAGKQKLTYIDEEGRSIWFKPLEPGQSCTNTSEHLKLTCHSPNHYSLQASNGLGLIWHFENLRQKSVDPNAKHSSHKVIVDTNLPQNGSSDTHSSNATLNNTALTLVRIEDPFGNALRIDRNSAGLATAVHNSQSTWVLNYTAQGQISQISQLAAPLVNQQAASNPLVLNQLILVQYRYNEHNQLIAAVDANGHEERYSYTSEHLLSQRTLKSGYNIYFEWQTHSDAVQSKGENILRGVLAKPLPKLLPNARCIRQWGDPVDGQATYHYQFEWNLDAENKPLSNARVASNNPTQKEQASNNSALQSVTNSSNSEDNTFHSAAIDSRGARREFRFNAQGLPTWERDALGHITRTRYTANGQILERIDAAGHSEKYQYNSEGYLIGLITKDGQSHRFELNTQGQVLRHIDAQGHIRTNTYTAEGLLASHTDATAITTKYRYNSLGLLCEIIHPLGPSTRLLYNAQGQLQAQTNPLGHSTTYQYDTWGRLVSQTNPQGRTSHYAYDLSGRCTRFSTHEGQITSYSYSPLGQLTSIEDDTGRRTQYEYSAGLSQPSKRTDALGHSLHYHYDSERNLVALVNENGQRSQFDYDLNERLVCETGFDGRKQTYRYNAVGHLIEKQEWGIHTVGAPTSLNYTASNWPAIHQAGTSQPSNSFEPLSWTRYSRDPQGRLLQTTHSDGEQAHYRYNSAGHLIAADNAHRQLAWELDAEGRVLAELQDQHRIAHQYNGTGWLKQTDWGAMGVGAPAGCLNYQYNALGQVQGMDFNGQMLAQFERDKLGREVKRKRANHILSQNLYDPQGRLDGQVHMDIGQSHESQSHKNQHNPNQNPGALSEALDAHQGQHQGPVIAARRYRYNQRNQIWRIDENTQGTVRSSSFYHYDALDRLRQVEGPNPEAFLFDPASNLLDMLHDEAATQAIDTEALPESTSPNARKPHQTPGNRLAFQGDTHYRYDELGRRIQSSRGKGQSLVTHYRYNAQSQLVEVEHKGQVTRYQYDALGRRIGKVYFKKTEQEKNTEQRAAQFNEQNHGQQAHGKNQQQTQQQEREPCAASNVTPLHCATNQGHRRTHPVLNNADSDASPLQETGRTSFYWNGDVLLGEVHSDLEKTARTYLFQLNSFEPLALVQNNEVFHCINDLIGTPREITNGQGKVVWSAKFRCYGALALQTVQEMDNPLRFQGQYYDEETGLHYNRHRYYDPLCGQFTTQDPIGLAGGINTYQYAPNPLMWVDPYGLTCKEGYGEGANSGTFAANEIRLSQNSVSFNKVDRVTGQSYTYDDLVASMRSNGWKGDAVDVVRMPDGKLTSMDNTRITAAREAGIDVRATVRSFDEVLTPEMQNARGWGNYSTWGEAITARINNQSKSFSTANPYGSVQSPRIKGKP